MNQFEIDETDKKYVQISLSLGPVAAHQLASFIYYRISGDPKTSLRGLFQEVAQQLDDQDVSPLTVHSKDFVTIKNNTINFQ